jgi:putative glutamine amidotransferase
MKAEAADAHRVPCVWVASSHRELTNEHGKPQRFTLVDESGTLTLINMGLQPVSFPRVPPDRIEAMLSMVDGVLLGGSATNVNPRLYGEEPIVEGMDVDPARDAVVQPLIRLAIAKRVPLIAFCRGSQEFNVAMGGTVHQSLQQRGGDVQHWEDPQESLDAQYRERHCVTCTPGGELERLAGASRFMVSSLHSQGVKDLGANLVAEARADDGLVEAFRWHDASLFAWGFQFHPEWGWRTHPAYGRIMNAYVRACWEHFAWRTGATVPGRETVA